MNRRILLPLLLVPTVLACALWSCIPTGGGGGVVHLGRGTVAVVPFATRRRDYFDSEVGARMSRYIATIIRHGRPKATVLDVDGITERLARLGRKPPAAGGWDVVQFGQDLGADYVVIGEIHDISGKPPKSYGTLAGTLEASASVLDVAARHVVWMRQRKKYRYPPLLLGKEPIAADERDVNVVLRKVMQEGARDVAAAFIGRARAYAEDIDAKLNE